MRISVLGSTGSIGTQTLEVARKLGDFEFAALTAHSNIELLEVQINEFRPAVAAVFDKDLALELSRRVSNTEVLAGLDGVIEAARLGGVDVVVNALSGNVGLLPTIAAIEAGADIALANKEVLVCAGEIIMKLAGTRNIRILPVDGEHSAVFQCLLGETDNQISKLYLTASGGPFRGKSPYELQHVNVERALAHPNWDMGKKISIDSATMMNKGLEVIEASRLFGLSGEQISVLVHPQSIIHAMVEFADGQILANMWAPDMRLPIQYALTTPQRRTNDFKRLDFTRHNVLTFEQPDYATFPCLRLGYEALEAGGLVPTVMSAANEAAVEMFLDRKIPFHHIPQIIDGTISAYNRKETARPLTVRNILEVESWAKAFAREEV